jgi:hypothetical protein
VLAPTNAAVVSLSVAWMGTEEAFDILTLRPCPLASACPLISPSFELSGSSTTPAAMGSSGVWGIGFSSDASTQMLGWRLDFEVLSFAEVGHSTCDSCDAGYFAASEGSSSCEACAANTFANASGLWACQACTACAPVGATLSQPCLGAATNNSATCACDGGYYGPGTSCSPCPANTVSDAHNTSTLLNCRCLAGFVCTYTKRITATVLIPNMTLADFSANYQQAFLAAIARAAGVDISQITIVTTKSGRRLLSAWLDRPMAPYRELTIILEILGSDHLDRTHIHFLRRTLSFVFEVNWQHDHLLRVERLR